MEYINYENKAIELKDNKYNIKDIFNILNYEYEPFFKTDETLYYSLNEFQKICKENNEKESKLLSFLKKYEKKINIFEFIKKKNDKYNLNLGNWFNDIWFPLFEKKNILITNDVLNFIHDGPGYMDIDYSPEFNRGNKIQLLIKMLNDCNVEFIEIKCDNPLSNDYEYIQNEIIQLTPDDLKEKTWILLSNRNFKSFIMRINTEKSQQIKDCYITLEEILTDFKNELKYEITISELEESFNNQLKIKDEQISNLESFKENVKNFINKVKIYDKNGYIYIATSKIYADKNCFKIGRTDNLVKRLSDFNTSRNSQDPFYICYFEEVYEVEKVEKLIHTLLDNFRPNKNKEMFYIHYSYLLELIPLVTKNINEPFEYINDLIKNKSTEMYNLKSYIPEPLPLKNKNIILDDLKEAITELLDNYIAENILTISKKEFIDKLNLNYSNKNKLWKKIRKILNWKNSKTPILHKNAKLIITYW